MQNVRQYLAYELERTVTSFVAGTERGSFGVPVNTSFAWLRFVDSFPGAAKLAR